MKLTEGNLAERNATLERYALPRKLKLIGFDGTKAFLESDEHPLVMVEFLGRSANLLNVSIL